MESQHTFESSVSLDELTRLRSESIEHRFNLVTGVTPEPSDEDAKAFAHLIESR